MLVSSALVSSALVSYVRVRAGGRRLRRSSHCMLDDGALLKLDGDELRGSRLFLLPVLAIEEGAPSKELLANRGGCDRLLLLCVDGMLGCRRCDDVLLVGGTVAG